MIIIWAFNYVNNTKVTYGDMSVGYFYFLYIGQYNKRY